MSLTVPELEAMRDALIRARANGVLSVMQDGSTVTYKSDRDMAGAIQDLEARIKRASATRTGTVTFSASKGL
jgi:hypothetical protein